jgi:hypothetical protein
MDTIQLEPKSLMSIPIPGLGKTFEIPAGYLAGRSISSNSSSSSSIWSSWPNPMSKVKLEKARANKKLLKKLRKRGKQHS